MNTNKKIKILLNNIYGQLDSKFCRNLSDKYKYDYDRLHALWSKYHYSSMTRDDLILLNKVWDILKNLTDDELKDNIHSYTIAVNNYRAKEMYDNILELKQCKII